MLDKRRHNKLTKSVPIDQQLIALHKEEMELKREMLKKWITRNNSLIKPWKYYRKIQQDLQISFLVHYKWWVYNSSETTLCSHQEIIIHVMTQAFPNGRDNWTINMLNGMDMKGM